MSRARATACLTLLMTVAASQAGTDPLPMIIGGGDAGAGNAAPLAVFALPGEAVELRLGTTAARKPPSVTIGAIEPAGHDRWRWLAPREAGSSGELWFGAATGDAAGDAAPGALNLFVLVPAAQVSDGYVGEYRIGRYPDGSPPRNDADYTPPRGFVEVTAANRHRRVSRHFRIGQFVSKQAGDWPRYVAPAPILYGKLERLLAVVRARGHDAPTLHVMSGYRTPFYNRAIGNVPFSRHIYGDAADVFVDVDADGNMDDLNGDGRVDVGDAITLARWLESIADDEDYVPFAGGLGIYDSTRYHGPFIHVDARGYRARWGLWPD